MKILYDHQTFTGSQYGGISRYFFELMNAFWERKDVDFELSLKFSNNEYLRNVPYAHPWGYARLANNFRANQAFSLVNRLCSSTKLNAGDFDIFHPTYYHSYFLDKIGKKPLVITFHDALSEKYGKQFPVLGEGLTELKQRLLTRADVVISVSEATKRSILEYFSIDETKVKVVPLGNYFERPTANHSLALTLPGRFVLFVGKRDFYKNFDRFFESVAPLLKNDKDLHLICAGGGGFSAEEKQAIAKQGLQSRVIYQPIIDDMTLIQLYEEAQVFVFPSLMEGFGLPILEAMSCGCPVAATTGTSFDEIAQDAAVYFEAENKESIRAAVEKVVYDETLQQTMRQRGYERVPLFRAETTAQKTLEVYKALV